MKKTIAMTAASLALLLVLLVTGCPQEEPGPDSGAEALDRIEIKKPPDKTVYVFQADTVFTAEGLAVDGIYTNGKRVPVPLDQLTITPPDLTTEGKKEVPVAWRGKKASFEVEVGKPPKSITLVTPPVKKFYVMRDAIDLTGAVVKAVYNDGSEKELTAADGITGRVNIPMSKAGPKDLLIRYLGAETAWIPLGVIAFGSEALRAFAADLAAKDGGASSSAPLKVKVPASIKSPDLLMEYPDEIVDNLGGLYIALGGKWVDLDLSEVVWTTKDDQGKEIEGIPGVTGNAYSWRGGTSAQVPQPRFPVLLTSLKLPPNIVQIGSDAFRGSGLTKVDLKDLSKLKVIGERAFASHGATVTEIDFTGCTSLELIGISAFTGYNRIQMLDLTPCTSLKTIQGYAFGQCSRLKYIEFPASLEAMFDYAMNYLYSLEYVRFRGNSLRSHVGWSNFLYTTGGNGGSDTDNPIFKPAVHQIYYYEEMRAVSMQNYVLFHPDTLGYRTDFGAGWGAPWFFHMDARDNPASHGVPLPYDQSRDSGYTEEVDVLRGPALLAYQEQYRGLDEVTVAAADLPAELNGQTVTANVGGVTGTIGGGSVNMTIPTPTAGELQELNPTTAQAITGYFRDTSRWLYDNYPTLGLAEAWNVRGRSGKYGVPVIWPDNLATAAQTAPVTPGYPRFVMLKLELSGGGTLERWGRAQYLNKVSPTDGSLVEEVKSVRYVYVDKDCTVYRTEDRTAYPSPLRFVWLNLKKGWNVLDATENFNLDETTKAPSTSADNYGGGLYRINIWISGLKMVDDTTLQNTKDGPYRSNSLNFKEIPWVKRTDNPYESITSQPVPWNGPGPRPVPTLVSSFWDTSLPKPDYRAPWRQAQ